MQYADIASIALIATGIPKPSDEHQVSHLCHQKHCFRPDHLAWETPKEIVARKGCPGVILTPDGKHYTACKHLPRCIVDTKVFELTEDEMYQFRVSRMDRNPADFW